MDKKHNYTEISEEKRKQLEEMLYCCATREFRKEEVEPGYHKYEVVLQIYKFITYMTEEELKQSAKLTINLVEEMKKVNNDGMDKPALERLVEEVEAKETEEVLRVFGIWNGIATDEIRKLIAEIDEVRRVGGAWAMLISNPGLISAIYAVYERLVDQFDDEDLYAASCFFLLRAIMRMHSEEVRQ